MFLNYLKVGIRNILKYKIFSFINVFGLAAAMSVSMLIMVMLADQRSYDQFNVNKDRIYRILSDKPDLRHAYSTSPFPLAGILIQGDPIVEQATHLMMGVGGDALYNNTATELRGYFADEAFFRIFSFQLGKGNPETALREPNSIVLSAAAAKRLFREEDPIGKSVTFTDRGLNLNGKDEASAPVEWGRYTITGVLEDVKYKSHLNFDALISASSMPVLIAENKIADNRGEWKNFYQCYTYVLVRPGKKGSDLDASLASLIKPHIAGISDLKNFKLTGQVLTSISPGILLGNEPSTVLPRIAYYILSVLALLIMFSACLNYTNLSIARALTRAREIGIRKINGAARENIIFQFLLESVLTSLFAAVLSVAFVFFLRAAFKGLWVNQTLHFELGLSWQLFTVFLLFGLLIGLVSGLYPAFYLSRFQPLRVLRSFSVMRPGKLTMRKILSVVQFALSLIFIISSVLIFNQSTHFMRFDYGFNPKNIVNIPLQGNDYHTALRELSTVRGIDKISACDYIPVTGRSEGANLKRALSNDKDFVPVVALRADENFINNLQLKLIAGNNLVAGSDTGRYVLLNESAAGALGFKDAGSAVGQFLKMQGSDGKMLQVAGVLRNFHLSLDHEEVEPLVIQNIPALFKFINVRIASPDVSATLKSLENKWKSIDPVHGFKYQFFDDQLASTSRGFFDIVSILGYMAFIAITIACLGMLGMATYTTERRIKEVGIRKTLGADESGLVFLLSGEFIRVLAIAILIAAPLSYFLNAMWLNKFPNRVSFGLGTILTGTLILLIPGIISIVSQTLRAARRNPVEALKME